MPRAWGGGVDISFITATSDKILEGYIGSDTEGNQIEGSMVNRGKLMDSLYAGDNLIIGEGYYSGGAISAEGLDTQTPANASAEYIVTGYNAWVNGKKIDGSMQNRGAIYKNLNCNESYTIPFGYHNGLGKITANSLSSQTVGTAGSGDILSGMTAWVNGIEIIGNMPNCGGVSASLNAGDSYFIPKGYHDGYGVVSAKSSSSQTPGTATAKDIVSGKTAWVNGSKLTGTMPTQSGQTIMPTSTQQIVNCSGKYMTGNVIINGVTPPPANAIKKGYTYIGVTGTFEGYCILDSSYLYYKGDNSGNIIDTGGFVTLESDRISVNSNSKAFNIIVKNKYDLVYYGSKPYWLRLVGKFYLTTSSYLNIISPTGNVIVNYYVGSTSTVNDGILFAMGNSNINTIESGTKIVVTNLNMSKTTYVDEIMIYISL